MRRRALVWLLVLSPAACRGGGGGGEPPARAERDAAVATIADAPPPPLDARPAPMLGPITVDEVKAIVPVPAEARVVAPHRKDAGAERVQVTFCFERGEVAALAARVADKLRAGGWQLEVRTPQPDRADLAAQHGELRLAGMMRRGPWVECPGAAGKTYVVLAVHRPAINAAP